MLSLHYQIIQDIFLFPLWFLFELGVIQTYAVYFQNIWCFSLYLIVINAHLILLWLENTFFKISVFWYVLRFILWPRISSILVNIPYILEKNVWFEVDECIIL